MLGPVFGLPMEQFGFDADTAFFHGLIVVFDDFFIEYDYVLALVVAYDIQVLQSGDDVLFFYAR